MDHSDFSTLFELAAGSLAKAARRDVEAHIESCNRCARDAVTARLLIETVRTDAMSEPPRAIVQRAISLWKRERPGRARRAIEALKAVLTFDSFASPLPAGVRAPKAPRLSARTRRLLYSAGEFDIDIAVERPATRRGRAFLRGQILSRASGGSLPGRSEARLHRVGGRISVMPLDGHGAFESGPLASGRYRLTVRGDTVEIVLDRLDVN